MEDKKTRIERLQQQLYAKDLDIKRKERSDLSEKEYSLKQDWNKKDEKKEEVINEPVRKNKFFSKILIAAFIFFIVSLGYAAFIFFGGGSNISGDDVSINIIGPVSVGGGEKLSLDVVIQNNNPIPLQVVDLVIDYPEGTKNPYDLVTDLRRDRISIGDVPAGSVVRKTIESSLFGLEGDSKEITVSVEYTIPGSNAIFNTNKTFDIVLTAAPVRLIASGLKEISSGQLFELDFKISSNTSKTLKNLMVIVDYPFGFDFESSNIEPSIDKNIWVFEEFKPGQEEDVKVIGRLSGQNNEDRIFRLNAGVRNEEQHDELGVIFTNVVHGVVIKKPFVNLTLTFDDSEDSEVAVKSGDVVRGKAVFNNNTNDTIRDVEIEIRLDGAILDDKTVNVSGGFYRSLDNTIIFNKDTEGALAEIGPREKENLTFSFSTFDLSIGGSIARYPQVKITSSVSGTRSSSDGGETVIKKEEYKTVKVLSDVITGAYTLYNHGPFTNQGSVPPIIEKPTTYTVLWNISSSSSDLEDMKITANIPSYVSWNNMHSPSAENISYDSNSRQVTWDIGEIPAGTGFTESPETVYFQVTLLPSISQLGTFPNLVKNTKITGYDTFTDTRIDRPVTDANTILQDYSDTVNDHHFVVE